MKTQKPGKRIDTWLLRPERQRERGVQFLDVEVEIRWSKGGTYHAEVDGVWYTSKDLDDLGKQLRDAVNVSSAIEWTRYIEVFYSADHAKRDEVFDNHPSWKQSASIEDDRANLDDDDPIDDERDERVIFAIRLTWRVVEFSQPFKPAGAPTDKRIRLMREVDGITLEASDRHEPQQDDELPTSGLLLFTPARHELLRTIQGMLAQVDLKLVELFRGDQDALARKLDALTDTSRLLTGATEQPPKAIAAKATRRKAR